MRPAERKRRLDRADELARERATMWRVFYARVRSNGVRLVEASTEHRAVKAVRGGYEARPVLPSRVWRAIYEEVGLPHPG